MVDLKTMRVLIAEDQALVRQGMVALISDLVGEVATYLIDTDYMWPQIKPAMQNILGDLTR